MTARISRLVKRVVMQRVWLARSPAPRIQAMSAEDEAFWIEQRRSREARERRRAERENRP